MKFIFITELLLLFWDFPYFIFYLI
jgi:hypothetical protein